MCLDTVTKTVVLKKDIRAKKVVYYNGRILVSGALYGVPIKKGLNTGPNTLECLYSTKNQKYNTGFHFFSIKIPNKIINEVYDVTEYESIIKVVIPRGTEVTYGYQTGDDPDNKLVCLVANKFIIKDAIKSIINKIERKEE